MGEVCACRYCRKMFKSIIKKSVCPDCMAKDDKMFEEIRHFLELHPYSNSIQVSEGTNIPTNEILRYIDEGRLSVKYDDLGYLLKIRA